MDSLGQKKIKNVIISFVISRGIGRENDCRNKKS